MVKKIKKEMTYTGHYIDRLILKDSLWKIAHRTAVIDWNHIDEVRQYNTGSFAELKKGLIFPKTFFISN